MLRRWVLLAIAAGLVPSAFAAHKTHNVIFVMTDGLRWQDVFEAPTLLSRNRRICGAPTGATPLIPDTTRL